MIISSSEFGMESSRRYLSVHMQSETMLGSNTAEVQKAKETFRNLLKEEQEDSLASQMEDSMLGLRQGRRNVSSVTKAEYEREEDSIQTIKTRCIFYLIRALFATKSQSNPYASLVQNGDSSGTETYERMSFQAEAEQTEFHTEGTVVTADGRQINFGLDLMMSRSFSEYYAEKYTPPTNAQLIDPLVINLDGNIANLGDQTFFFDLDGDGTQENIHALTPGSGYLALDRNGDGVINDGNELFGTKSGNGFEDLRMFDEDGNGWIDENDEIWNKLQIWTKGEDGKDMLFRLAEKGVGAICLRHVETQFSLNQANSNAMRGMIRNTGMFLYENGEVGTVMHLDVAT